MSKRHYLSPRSKIKVVEQDALLGVTSIEEDNNPDAKYNGFWDTEEDEQSEDLSKYKTWE